MKPATNFKPAAAVPGNSSKNRGFIMTVVLVLTLFHVLVSLIAIFFGIGIAFEFLKNQSPPRATMIYMIFTALTLVTSFLFPFKGMTPAIAIGILCVLIFIPTAYARYRTAMTGFWRPVYVVGAMLLLYFNCLVLIVQSFQKVPPLHMLAPTGGELAVTICQVILLVAAIAIGFFAVRRFRAGPPDLRLVR
jgi:hypothetical protein